ncbi:MAG: hypothetical protein U0401_32265 [Anaerolineae bacterium]
MFTDHLNILSFFRQISSTPLYSVGLPLGDFEGFHALAHDILGLPGEDFGRLAAVLVEFAEDIHYDIGL